ncbi:TonB-dependent receptor [Luminiphilus sp.]|nr:TonB-dependent receptor [Luminiphilus sp.]
MSKSIHGSSAFSRIIRTAICAGLIAGSGVNANAQDGDPVMEEVIVTGIRGTLEKNLDIKRDASAFVDAITAEDIGKFPDKNIADALQRVPGVSITRDGGEGQFVSVRGVSSDLTMTLLNGNYIATGQSATNPSRSFNYSLLPSNLISSVEVYKSPEARIDEGGIGGTIIINTRKPLEMESGSGFLNFESTYSDVTEDWEGQYSGLINWKNEDETFGILASVTQQNRSAVSEYSRTENWQYFCSETPFGACGETAVEWTQLETVDGRTIQGYAPFAVVIGEKDEERERLGYQLTMQWQPTENFGLTFNYIGSTLGQNSEIIEQNGYQSDFWTSLSSAWPTFCCYKETMITDFRVDNGTITMLQMEDLDPTDDNYLASYAGGGFIYESESTSDTYDIEMDFSGEGWDARANVGSTKSEGGITRGVYQRFRATNGSTTSWGWDFNSSQVLQGEHNGYNAFDWHQPDYAGDHSDEETYAQLDVSFDYELAIFESFDVGFKWRDHEVARDNSNAYFDEGTPDNYGGDYWWCTTCGYSWHHDPANYPGADVVATWVGQGESLTGNAGTGTTGLMGVDWDTFDTWVEGNFDEAISTNQATVFNVKEEITSLYVQGNFAMGAISGNIGVRYADTKQEAITLDDIDGLRDETPEVRKGGNSQVLPSLNMKWDAADDLVVRASAAKVMSRVQYSDLGASLFWYPIQGGIGSGSGGNPDLEPYQATQYDLGLEWYFEQGAILGATLFSKDINTFVVTDSYITNLNYDGTQYPVSISGPVNGSDATSEGIEIFYQQAFDWGGGVFANYTYTDTSLATLESQDGSTRRIPLTGASENQYNVSAYYETDDWSARVSYNWRDSWAAFESNGKTVFTDDYGQVDMNATYSFSDQLQLNASVVNLTEENNYQYWGQKDRLLDDRYSGRRFYVGVNYKF